MTFALDLLNAPWAILPERLLEIEAIYQRRVAEGRIEDLAQFSAAVAVAAAPQDKPRYAIDNGVAVVPLVGVLAKRANAFHAISGGASHAVFARDMAAAAADPRVEAILVEIDSPGGTVDGTPMAALAVRNASAAKPITALADSLMASAAYWIGAFAEEIVAVDTVTQVGSIGVVARHVDTSKAEEQRGIKVTEIVAGKFKRVASQHEPLNDAGRASLQESVDAIYAEFVSAVALGRRRSVDDVLAHMADGRVFHAKAAVDAGLVDRIASRDEAMDRLRNRARAHSRSRVPRALTTH